MSMYCKLPSVGEHGDVEEHWHIARATKVMEKGSLGLKLVTKVDHNMLDLPIEFKLEGRVFLNFGRWFGALGSNVCTKCGTQCKLVLAPVVSMCAAFRLFVAAGNVQLA